MKKYLDKLQNMPIGISGTCLAFITLSNSWKLKGINYFKPIAIFLAVCMLSLMILRLIRFPKVMYEELKNPVTGTFYPTMGMVVWLVSGFFYPYFPVVCSWLWIAAVIYHYGIVIFYTVIRIKERKFENIMPTCFIVYTGMIAWLVITGLILLVVVYGYILKLFKEGFKPSYAAFTFPLAIATLSAFKLSTYFTGLGYDGMANLFKFLGDVEIFIATYVIFFMLLNFLNMFFKAISPKLGEYVEEEEELIGGTLYSK